MIIIKVGASLLFLFLLLTFGLLLLLLLFLLIQLLKTHLDSQLLEFLLSRLVGVVRLRLGLLGRLGSRNTSLLLRLLRSSWLALLSFL